MNTWKTLPCKLTDSFIGFSSSTFILAVCFPYIALFLYLRNKKEIVTDDVRMKEDEGEGWKKEDEEDDVRVLRVLRKCIWYQTYYKKHKNQNYKSRPEGK